jgi:radical SAM superfamily enzyme YgiQ (UPF0313 family)
LLHLEPLELEIVAGGISSDREVRILDLSLERRPERAFLRELRGFAPDVLGFTAYSNQEKAVLSLAESAKRLFPGIAVIIGGVHATIATERFERSNVIDAVLRGEGGTVIESVLEYLEEHGIFPDDDRVLRTDATDFAERAKAPPPPFPEPDDVPRPRRGLVDANAYFCVWAGEPGERMATIFPPVATTRTSVGCPNKCSFCVTRLLTRGKYKRRSPADVADEIAALEQDHVYFVDDEMFIDAKRAAAIAELLISRGVSKRYVSWARSDTIVENRDVFALWKEAGLSTVYVGLEAMDDETLEGYSKGCSADVNRRAIDILSELGICLHAAFMVDPMFEEEDFIHLREAVESVGTAEVTFTVFSPPPGTSIWEERKSEFIVDEPHLFYDCMHTILPTRLPLNRFYRYFSLLSLFALRNNPWRRRKVKAPMRDFLRLFMAGAKYGWAQRNIYKDYPGKR